MNGSAFSPIAAAHRAILVEDRGGLATERVVDIARGATRRHGDSLHARHGPRQVHGGRPHRTDPVGGLANDVEKRVAWQKCVRRRGDDEPHGARDADRRRPADRQRRNRITDIGERAQFPSHQLAWKPALIDDVNRIAVVRPAHGLDYRHTGKLARARATCALHSSTPTCDSFLRSCLLLCSLALVARGQSPNLAAPLPLDTAVIRGTLPNGLHYLVRRNAQPAHRAELRLVVNAGSILESDAQRGLAHFVEHMAFNGTKRFPKSDIVNFLERVGMRFGADLNAYTSFDETVYSSPCPPTRRASWPLASTSSRTGRTT